MIRPSVGDWDGGLVVMAAVRATASTTTSTGDTAGVVVVTAAAGEGEADIDMHCFWAGTIDWAGCGC